MAQTYTVCLECDRINRVESESRKPPLCGACHHLLPFHGGISDLSGTALRKLVSSSKMPIVADFWAPWCGPCRSFAPTFEQAARQWAGRFIFVKIDIDRQPLAADYYSVRSVPMLIVFSGGLERLRQAGAVPAHQFQAWLVGLERDLSGRAAS